MLVVNGFFENGVFVPEKPALGRVQLVLIIPCRHT
jgi:hypothetical protein